MTKEFEYIFSGLSALEAEGKLRQIIDTALVQKYGENPDDLIVKRVTEEWAAMERTEVIADIATLYELAAWLKDFVPVGYYNRKPSATTLLLPQMQGNTMADHICRWI